MLMDSEPTTVTQHSFSTRDGEVPCPSSGDASDDTACVFQDHVSECSIDIAEHEHAQAESHVPSANVRETSEGRNCPVDTEECGSLPSKPL